MRRIACLALLLPCLHLFPAHAEVRVLVAGVIHTGDERQPVATALAWESDDGRLLAVGARDALLRRYPQAVRVDVGNATVVPGLIDAHAHLSYLGDTLAQADLSGARSRAEVVQRLRAFEQTLAPGEWLVRWPGGPTGRVLPGMPSDRALPSTLRVAVVDGEAVVVGVDDEIVAVQGPSPARFSGAARP